VVESAAPEKQPRERHWDALAAVVAALIGFLALLVSGYTAYVQRQQVRAQVWPFLLIGYADPDRSIIVMNKGVGPARVRAMRVTVDDQPKRDWNEVLQAMGIDSDDKLTRSTVSGNVMSPGERIEAVQLPDAASYERFRLAAQKRMKITVCYCSTLEECWLRDRKARTQVSVEVEACPAWPVEQQFKD
jgi:hypothetical protein